MWQRYRPALLLLFGVALLAYVVIYIRDALLLLWVAVLLAIMVAPAVDWISGLQVRKWRPSRGAAVLLFAAFLLVLLAGFAVIAVPKILHDLHALENNWPHRIAQMHEWAQQHAPFLAGSITQEKIAAITQHLLGSTVSGAVGMGKKIADFLMMLLVAAYLVIDREQSLDWLVSLFPRREQARLKQTLVLGGRRTQRWISGQLLLMLIHGASATVAFGILHVRYFYLLGIFAGVINIIPVLGPVLTLLVAGVVAAIDAPAKVLGVVIFYLVYHNLENAVLNPRIMEAKVRIPAITVVVAIVLGDGLAGIVGILVSVPTAVLAAVLINEYVATGPRAQQARQDTIEHERQQEDQPAA